MCLAQVYGVGGGDLRRMPDFRGASGAEMQGWPAKEWVYGVLRGAAQPVQTPGRSVERWVGEWRL